jgi:hypothetical protein
MEAAEGTPGRGTAERLLAAFSGERPVAEHFQEEELGAWSLGRLLYPRLGRVARGLPRQELAAILAGLLARPSTEQRVRVLELGLALPELREAYRTGLESTTPAERAAAARCLRQVAEPRDRTRAARLLAKETDRRVRGELAALASR